MLKLNYVILLITKKSLEINQYFLSLRQPDKIKVYPFIPYPQNLI